MIAARILADSINPAGVRLTSWLLTYPRSIHSEFMTHRVFSRNAASSRAIPLEKMLDTIRANPAMPVHWGAEKPGMASGDCIEHPIIAKGLLEQLGMLVCNQVEDLKAQYGFHKSIANRYIEPWAHMTCVATATDHRNFFQLRAHPAAQPEFQVLAYMMLREYRTSAPNPVKWGEWHIPDFKPDIEKHNRPIAPYDDDTRLKVAVARCARLSYLTFDGEFSVEKDLELFERLKGPPMHASPFEHVAQAVESDTYDYSNFDHIRLVAEKDRSCVAVFGPSHWLQYRKTFWNENGQDANLDDIAATEPEWVAKLIDDDTSSRETKKP